MEIKHVTMQDLPDILRIEKSGFTDAEAGTESQYRDRIKTIPDTFLTAKQDGKLVGYVVGPAVKEEYVDDEMFAKSVPNLPEGGNQIILSIAIDPQSRGYGIGSQLLDAFEKLAKESNRKTVSLTSLDKNVPFYEKNGYVNKGVADSEHANETWYNLVKTI
ncbi:GNAT family N-acetyltransferase [Companilactobacillus sp.]|uniref:GNAT family N-acetyltransferase n=1 Tax=Companilactobacillus sp. TaxID=2767905 RepID=UPI0026180C03|nr:GNAT family N-acetyltransferase [Companilactobacillus sp.]